MPKKFALAGAAIALTGGLVYLDWASEPANSPVAAVPALGVPASSQLPLPSNDMAVAAPSAVPRVPQLVVEGSREEVRQAFGAVNERQLSDGRHFIQFSTEDVRGLALYDTFEIRLEPGSSPAVGVVEAISELEGMRRVSGKFNGAPGSDERDVFSITVSADGGYAVGNFSRAGKAYALESKSGAGWITNPDAGARALHQSGDVVH